MKSKYSLSQLIIIFSFFIFLLPSCSSNKKIASTKLSFNTISFGKSGGFTNLKEEYIINNNRSIFKLVNGNEEVINKVDKPLFSEIDKQIIAMNFFILDIHANGNITYFIEIKKESNSNKVTWTDSTENTEIKELYKTLVSTLTKAEK